MYSVVLATMLTAGSATPAWHHCHSCHSCYSCYSGYSGYSGYSCYSCYSGCYCSCSCHRPIFHRCHGYSGCYCSSCYCSSCYCSGYSYGCSCFCSAPVVISPCCGGPVTNPKVVPVPPDPKKDKKSGEEVSAPAKVTVALPSDARLWVDNVECPLTSSVRSFDTPALIPNQQYFYNVKVEIVRDGRTISETQRVVLTPGRESRVDFNTSAVIGTASR